MPCCCRLPACLPVEFTKASGTTTPAPTSPPAPTGGTPAPTATVQCNTWPASPAQTLLASTDTPASASLTDGVKLVLGLRFTTAGAGSITALRYFKATGEGNTGHSGRIYSSATGLVLGNSSVTSDSSCTGGKWVTLRLATPVRTTAGTEYTAGRWGRGSRGGRAGAAYCCSRGR